MYKSHGKVFYARIKNVISGEIISEVVVHAKNEIGAIKAIEFEFLGINKYEILIEKIDNYITDTIVLKTDVAW